MLQPVVPILRDAQSVYMATHISPDGDAIGSSLGLAWALRALGKSCTVACADAVPAALAFLPGSEQMTNARPVDGQDIDVILVLDTGDLERLGSLHDKKAFACCRVVNIDHHLTNTRFGDVNIVDPQAAAVGEMIFDLIQMLGVALDTNMATCLLTALVTDTIGYRTPSTTPRTLTVAAALMEAGASLSDIVRQAFESRPLPVLRVWGHVLSTFTVEDGIAWACLSQQELKELAVRDDEVKGLVNVMRGTQDVVAAALMLEGVDGKIKVEFRSSGEVNVAEIAIALGGGGHRAAAGCLLPGPMSSARQRVLDTIRGHMPEPAARA